MQQDQFNKIKSLVCTLTSLKVQVHSTAIKEEGMYIAIRDSSGSIKDVTVPLSQMDDMESIIQKLVEPVKDEEPAETTD